VEAAEPAIIAARALCCAAASCGATAILPEPWAAEGAGAGVVAALVEVWVAGASVGCCVCWTTTRGLLVGLCGALVVPVGVVGVAGCVVVVLCVGVVLVGVLEGGVATGVGVVVVPVAGGVVVVMLLVADCVGASGAGVVDVPEGGARPVGGSAASAPPDSGPPSPAAVKPPPASAERITRRAAVRALFTPGISGPCSSWSRPMVALEQGTQNAPSAP
jgi:hypothetical protein